MKEYSINSIFDFGKYKGEWLRKVLTSDPEYVKDCIQKVEFFRMRIESFSEILQYIPDNQMDMSTQRAFFIKASELTNYYNEEY